jgi:hypothetical protein
MARCSAAASLPAFTFRRRRDPGGASVFGKECLEGITSTFADLAKVNAIQIGGLENLFNRPEIAAILKLLLRFRIHFLCSF